MQIQIVKSVDANTNCNHAITRRSQVFVDMADTLAPNNPGVGVLVVPAPGQFIFFATVGTNVPYLL